MSTTTDPITEIQHRNDVPWYKAPLPSRLHRCRAQTRGWGSLQAVERCSCGAFRWSDGRRWYRKNERRRKGRAQ